MFQKVRSIDTAFRSFRAFAFAVMMGSLLLAALALYEAHKTSAAAASRKACR